ncbi:ABC transporter permease [Clostridium ljungdahlii]|uniref:Sulfate transport system permease protein CysW n=1 Tax=Clostridium ljungdahlii TaxID=1538 RepID=A0A168LBM4_9CLOT|nr:ABC transporter permease [Clostridium ljungdahlii]OAA82937.1 Sulfate transport system permease protein CysW [Clostridium ljungdahlii]
MSYLGEVIEITLLSLFVSITSTLMASAVGMTLAIPTALKNFRLKKYILRLFETLMSIPPVLMGLVVYLLLSRKGPLGTFKLLFTPTAMIIAQSLLVFPIIFGLTVSTIGIRGIEIKKNCIALGAENKDTLILIIKECKAQLLSVIAAGFGRAISEVGAVMMVGGNIKGETRVMTTYIALETGQGNFNEAITIGCILLIVSFMVNFILHKLSKTNK